MFQLPESPVEISGDSKKGFMAFKMYTKEGRGGLGALYDCYLISQPYISILREHGEHEHVLAEKYTHANHYEQRKNSGK